MNSLAVGDFDRDGRLDVVTIHSDASVVSVLIGDGSGSFAAPVSFDVGTNPNAIAVGDVNDDGKLDLVTANSSTVTLLQGQ